MLCRPLSQDRDFGNFHTGRVLAARPPLPVKELPPWPLWIQTKLALSNRLLQTDHNLQWALDKLNAPCQVLGSRSDRGTLEQAIYSLVIDKFAIAEKALRTFYDLERTKSHSTLEALKNALEITCLNPIVYSKLDMSQGGCDALRIKSIAIEFQCDQLFVLLSVGEIRVACLEAKRVGDQWIAEVNCLWPSVALTYVGWGIEVVIDGKVQKPKQLRVQVRYAYLFFQPDLRFLIGRSQINISQDLPLVHCIHGAPQGGLEWMKIPQPSPLWLIEPIPMPLTLGFSLPNRPGQQFFLEPSSGMTELELAICRGDFDAVEALIQRESKE